MRVQVEFDKLHDALMWLIIETYDYQDEEVTIKNAMDKLIEIENYMKSKINYRYRVEAFYNYEEYMVRAVEVGGHRWVRVDAYEGNINSPYYDNGWKYHKFERIEA